MISHTLYDAWKITPPCELIAGDCHTECPYYNECQGMDLEKENIIMLDELIYSRIEKERRKQ